MKISPVSGETVTRNNPMTNIYTIETNSTRAEHSCENVSTKSYKNLFLKEVNIISYNESYNKIQAVILKGFVEE